MDEKVTQHQILRALLNSIRRTTGKIPSDHCFLEKIVHCSNDLSGFVVSESVRVDFVLWEPFVILLNRFRFEDFKALLVKLCLTG